ncbi:lipopolysaccharide biosynthesis protein [Luteimonas sp. A534]
MALRRKFESIQGMARIGFVRSVGQLAGGTALAQAVMVLALPVLTRLYSPDDFAIFATYAATLSILTAGACLRFEVATPLPENDRAGASLLALALASSALLSVVLAAVVLLFPGHVAGLFSVPGFEPYLWMIPLGVWVASSYMAMQYWSTRKKKFPKIARTRAAQAIGGVGTQMGLGWVGVGPFGLLLGHMVSGGAGIVSLARDAWRSDRAAMRSVSPASMAQAMRDYSKFPKYSAPEAIFNMAGSQLPIILIAALAVGPEAGFLMLAVRVMGAPLMLIGSSVAQVYLSRAADEFRRDTLPAFTEKIVSGLIKTGVGPIIFVGIIAPLVFPVVFGDQWRRAGELVTWMMPWAVLQFLSSPVSMVMQVRMQQRRMFLLTVCGLVFRVGTIVAVSMLSPTHVVEAYAIAAATYYLILNLVLYRASGCGLRMLAGTVWGSLVVPVAWSVLGVAVWAISEWI